jgi:hypothetical protein
MTLLHVLCLTLAVLSVFIEILLELISLKVGGLLVMGLVKEVL